MREKKRSRWEQGNDIDLVRLTRVGVPETWTIRLVDVIGMGSMVAPRNIRKKVSYEVSVGELVEKV